MEMTSEQRPSDVRSKPCRRKVHAKRTVRGQESTAGHRGAYSRKMGQAAGANCYGPLEATVYALPTLSELKHPHSPSDRRPQRGRTPGQRSTRIRYTCSQRIPWVYLRASWFFRRLVCVWDHNAILRKHAFLKSAANFRVDVHLDSALLLLH